MPRINLDKYVTVDQRLVKFWEQFPNGGISTELLYIDDRVVRVKATICADRTIPSESKLATGHAEEYRITEAQIQKNPKLRDLPNATSALENCETSAVGRALALAGYEVTKGVASREEMEKVRRHNEAAEMEARRYPIPESTLDNHETSAKVSSNGAEHSEKLTPDEARALAGTIKSTGIEISAVKLKLVTMGIEEKKTLSETLQTMNKDEAQELHSWVIGETSNEGQTTTV
jgi:hypothetical protein